MPQYIKIYQKSLPLDLCSRLIAKFEGDDRVQPDPQPEYSTRKFLSISPLRDWAPLTRELAIHLNKVCVRYFEKPGDTFSDAPDDWSDDGFIMSRYDPGDTCVLHADGQCGYPPNNGLRLVTALFYLNPIPTGGETYFPLQKVKIKPEAGAAVLFPPTFTHPHEVLAAEKPRYIVQTWITDPELFVVRGDAKKGPRFRRKDTRQSSKRKK